MMRTTSTRRRFLASLLVGLLLAPPAAWAGPSGENVVSGNVDIARDGTNTTITAGNRSIIEWDNFDIGVDESVRFIQPSRRARVLNRVVGPNATYIDGQLRANGTVYILNQYGIYLGDTAVVEVANLIAGAGNLSNADFLRGVDRFTELGGAVENLGRISGASVTLLGKSVANHGSISATNGRIWMLAGDEVIVAEHGSPVILRIGTPSEGALDQYAVENTGTLDAGNRGAVRMAAGDLLSLAIRNSGTIRAREITLAAGEGSRVQVGGLLDASNTLGGPNRDGGTIDIRGDYVFVDGATLDASGRRGGGTIHIGGDIQGVLDSASLERNSQLTFISDDSIVRSDALLTGDGGEIVAWSDGVTIVDGKLSAKGADRRGNGGFVETSGKKYLSADVVPDLDAKNGLGGHWLIDPANITIVAPGTDLNDSINALTVLINSLATEELTGGAPTFLPNFEGSQIEANTLEAALGRGFDITISTELFDSSKEPTADEGNIVFQEGLDFDSPNTILPGTNASLTLFAANRIEVEAGSGGIDDTNSPNLALSIFFRAGDATQTQLDSAAFIDDGSTNTAAAGMNESIDIFDAINVRGAIDFSAEDIFADATMTGQSMTLNARHAIRTRNLVTTGRDMNLRSASGNVDILGSGGATPDVMTEGGSILISSLRGDVTIAGSVDLRDDITDNAVDATGGSLQIDALPLAEAVPPADVGGDVTLTKIDANDEIRAPSGLFLTAGRDMSVDQDIVSLGGNATFRVTDNLQIVDVVDDDGMIFSDQPFVPGEQTMAINGDVTTNGGEIRLEMTQAIDLDVSVDVTVAGNLNADNTDPSRTDGDVLVLGSGQVDIANNAVFTGDTVQISAGLDGSGDLNFQAPTTINAGTAVIEAGNGYSPEPIDPASDAYADFLLRLDSKITGLSQVTLQQGTTQLDASTPLEDVAILQDADFATGVMPTMDFTGATQPRLEINSRDGMVHVEAGSLNPAALPADLQLALLGAGGSRGPAFQLDQELDFERVDLGITGSFTIDANTASMASGANTEELRILAGRGGILPNDSGRQPDFLGVPGGLLIEDGVTLSANETLVLHGAVNGVGDFAVGQTNGRGVQVGDGVTLRANDINLVAGDGPGGANFVLDPNGFPVFPEISDASGGPVTNLTIENTDATDVHFTFWQERSIGVDDLPPVTDPDSTIHYRAIADEGTIFLGDTTAPVLANNHVTLVARGYDFSLLTTPINTLDLDLGGISSFEIDDDLLSNFNWANNALTLRAGVGRTSGGTLSFANGTTVSADGLRLIASDGLGFQTTADIDVRGATFTAVNPLLAPHTFVMEQDADLTIADLPTAADIGDGSDLTVPSTLALRSVDGGILFDSVPTIFHNRLVLAAPLVEIAVEDADLDLSATAIPDLEIRAEQITLRAVSSSDTDGNDYEVLFDTAGVSSKFYGYDVSDGGSEEGDLDLTPLAPALATAPDVFTVQQDVDLLSSTLPVRADFGGAGPAVNNATLYRLHADQDASVNVDDAARVDGTSLELRLLNYDDADATAATRTVSLGSTSTYNLEGLDITVPGSLTLTDIDVNAVGLVRIEAGTRGDPNGDLIFEVTGANPDSENEISATEIRLLAGSTSITSFETAGTGEELAEVRLVGGPLDLSFDPQSDDFATALTIEQDASLDSSTLIPGGVTMVPGGTYLDFLALTSRRGDLDVDINDVLNSEVLLFSAGTHAVSAPDTTEDISGRLTLSNPLGDLDLGHNTTAHVTDIALNAEDIELVADSPNARIHIHTDRVTAAGATQTQPNSVLLRQDAAFDFTDISMTGQIANVFLADQFNGSVLGLDLQLESLSHDFLVNDEMAAQISSFDLTLDNKTNAVGGPHTITLDPLLATSQRFFGIHAITSDVFVDTPEFSTLSIQAYDAPVTFLQSSTLTGLDILFADVVQASTTGVDLDIYAARRVMFAEGVGSSGGLNPLAAGNQLNDLGIFFLDQGEVEFGTTAPAGSDIFAIGEVADSFDNTNPLSTKDTGVYLQGDLNVHTVDGFELAANDMHTPITRTSIPSVATAYKRGTGTLRIEADNVSFGNVTGAPRSRTAEATGEKLTVLGALEIVAPTGMVAVGDLTANHIDITADELVVIKRRGGSVRGPSGAAERDAGVDWVANTFALATTPGNETVEQVGSGRRLVIGTSGPQPDINGVPLDAPVFAIKPNLGTLPASDLLFDADGPATDGFSADTVVLDGKPRGPSSADLSNSIPGIVPSPDTTAPHGDNVVEPDAFAEVGITTRTATGREFASRANNRGIYDDASRAWRSDREVAKLTSARLDVPNASEARRLFREVFGPELGKAAGIRAVLGQAVADYQAHTGVRRVLGFELRRYLKNRPSTQFAAYQILEELDQLFSAHRRSGLVPGEYAPVQRAWVEAITPDGIAPDELGEAIQPSRYVRGSDVLDVFGD